MVQELLRAARQHSAEAASPAWFPRQEAGVGLHRGDRREAGEGQVQPHHHHHLLPQVPVVQPVPAQDTVLPTGLCYNLP